MLLLFPFLSIGYRRTYFVLLLAQCSAGTVSALVADLSHFSLLRFVIGLSLPTAAVLPSDLSKRGSTTLEKYFRL